MFQELTADAPKLASSYAEEPYAPEAKEGVRATLIEFPSGDQPEAEAQAVTLESRGHPWV